MGLLIMLCGKADMFAVSDSSLPYGSGGRVTATIGGVEWCLCRGRRLFRPQGRPLSLCVSNLGPFSYYFSLEQRPYSTFSPLPPLFVYNM